MQEIESSTIVKSGKNKHEIIDKVWCFTKDEKLLMLICTFGGIIIGILIGHAM